MSIDQKARTEESPGARGRRGALVSRLENLESVAHHIEWTADYRRLKAGPIFASGWMTRTDTATVFDVTVSHQIEISGRTWSDLIAVVLPLESTGIVVNGYKLTAGDLLVQPADREFVAWGSRDSRVMLVLFPACRLEAGQSCDREGSRLLLSGETMYVNQDSPHFDRLRAKAAAIQGEPGDPDVCAVHAEMAEYVRRLEVPRIPGRSLECSSFNIIRRATDYIGANLTDAISIKNVGDAAATSLSRLERAFRSELGLTPSQYVLARRLDAARNRLLRKNGTSVAAVAFDCGFNHLGRFSGAYRRFYGELPSETLRTR